MDGQSVTIVSPAKMVAEPIPDDVWVVGSGGPENHVSDGIQMFLLNGQFEGGSGHPL